MSFLNDLGNIFHSIGSFFGGGNNQPQNNNQVQPDFTYNPNPNTNIPFSSHNLQQVQQANQPNQPPQLSLIQPGQLNKNQPVNQINPNMPQFNINDLTNGTLARNQQVQQQAAAQPTSTDNKVGKFIGGIVHPFAQFGNALIHVPQAVYREIQNKPIDDIQQQVFGTTDSGQIAKDILGDTAQVGLTAIAPGVDNLAEEGAARILPEASNAAEQVVSKLAPKVVSGMGVGGGFGAANAYENNQNVLQGAATGAELGGAGGALFGSVPLVKNLMSSGDKATDDAIIAGTAKAPNEIEIGLKSANPAQGADALQQISQKEAEQAQPVVAENPQGGAPAPAGEQPTAAVVQPAANPQAATPPQAIQVPEPGATAPNAPDLRAQAQKNLDTIGKSVDNAGKVDLGKPTEHNVLSNDQLNEAAARVNSTMPDEELVANYKTGATINNAADLAQANNALQRLGPLAAQGNEDAKQAIANILDAAEQHVSGGGRSLNYAQTMYDTMPKEAKTAYLVNSINKVRTANGLETLSQAEQARAENTINSFLTEIEDHQQTAAGAQGQIQQLMDEAKAGGGNLSKEDLAQIDQLKSQATTAEMQVQRLNSDLARAYDQFAPQKLGVKGVGQQAGNLGRSLMLTSASGRMSDILTTGINTAHSLLQNTGEALIGKALNFGRSLVGKEPGKYIDTLPSPRAFVQGTREGLQKAAGNYKGDIYSPDLMKAIKSGDTGGKTQLLRAGRGGVVNTIRNVSHAMAETATNLSQGVKNTRILQEAYQEGKQAGLTGNDLDVYARGRAAVPTKLMDSNGQKLLDEVNNMNDNPISKGLSTASKAFDSIPVMGEQIRNVIAPFTRWLGGAAWNGITDKNAVANFIKAGMAIKDGDSQELMHQLSGLALNTAGTMSAGYALAKSGMLSTTNAQGYDDDGLYLHLGKDYIPVGFLGFMAPGIVMGGATYSALNQNKGGSVSQHIMDVASNTLGQLSKAYLNNTLVGGNNETLNTLQDFLGGKNGVTGKDVAAQVGGDTVGQYIPGAFGDVNEILNNQAGNLTNPFNGKPLNPTNEASLTKVTKGDNGVTTKTGQLSKAKDIPGTVLNQTENRIPFLSQNLPRNPGVAAPTFVARITRGDTATNTEIKKAQDAQTQKDQIASDAAQGIPNPKGTYKDAAGKTIAFNDQVENVIESGHYDKAITGLQEELSGLKGQPKTKTDPVENQIKQLGVLQDQKLDPSFRNTYAKTTVSEWRAMGDPTSDTYDPQMYQKLYAYDKALASNGVAGGSGTTAGSSDKPKFTLAKAKSSSGGATTQAKNAAGGTIGSTPQPTSESFVSNLTATPNNIQIPQIKLTSPETLIKRRTISVKSPAA